MAELFQPPVASLADQTALNNNTTEHDEADSLLRTLVSQVCISPDKAGRASFQTGGLFPEPQTQLLAALHWLNKSQVLACIPSGETVPFQNVAEMACVSVSELSRVIRFTAVSGFLCEPRTNLVAHTDLSRHYLLRTALSDAILFFGDTVLATALNTPLTTQLQGRAAHGCNPAFPLPCPGTALQLDGHYHQPRLKRQATAFQRQVLQQALSCESTTADLMEMWMADASPNNFTVVQVCCESDAMARIIAHRHPQLYFIIQLTTKVELAYENKDDDDDAGLGHMTIQYLPPKSSQRMTDAWLYIVHLPTPSILATPADILSQATHMLWTHFSILRQNKYSRLVIVANGLVGSAKTNSKAEAAGRMCDVLLMQMTRDKHAITMDQMEQLVGDVRDASWRLVIWTKESSDTHPTVAFEVRLVAI